MFSDLFELMGMMFLLMASGAILRKINIITIQGKKVLADIILFVILPCNIIKAFCIEIQDGLWHSLTKVLLAAILIQMLCLLLTKFIYNKMNEKEKAVYQYGTICSNAGFMGNPLAQGVFGDMGLLYASIFLIPQRIVMWTAGISYFSKEAAKKSAVKKVLIHPCMIAVYIGLFILISGIWPPAVLLNTIQSYSSCTTAMTMMYIGTILTEVDFKTVASIKQIYFAFIRLIFIPLIVFLICKVGRIDSLIAGVCVLLTAMPAGSTTSLLAFRYGADEETAAKSIVFTTALSVITLPIWSAILLS